MTLSSHHSCAQKYSKAPCSAQSNLSVTIWPNPPLTILLLILPCPHSSFRSRMNPTACKLPASGGTLCTLLGWHSHPSSSPNVPLRVQLKARGKKQINKILTSTQILRATLWHGSHARPGTAAHEGATAPPGRRPHPERGPYPAAQAC